jgi:hypothetical protein
VGLRCGRLVWRCDCMPVASVSCCQQILSAAVVCLVVAALGKLSTPCKPHAQPLTARVSQAPPLPRPARRLAQRCLDHARLLYAFATSSEEYPTYCRALKGSVMGRSSLCEGATNISTTLAAFPLATAADEIRWGTSGAAQVEPVAGPVSTYAHLLSILSQIHGAGLPWLDLQAPPPCYEPV